MLYRIEDENGATIETGFISREAAYAAALRWESENKERAAFVEEDEENTTSWE